MGTDAGDDALTVARHPGGRPRIYTSPRRAINLHVDERLVDAMDAVRGPDSRVAYIERVLRERPEIAERLTHASTQSEEHDDDGD